MKTGCIFSGASLMMFFLSKKLVIFSCMFIVQGGDQKGWPFFIAFSIKGSCTYYVITDRGGVSPNDYSIT